MARKEKKPKEGASTAWMVTFSDLVTLLLTFFVLLLSMASMDKSIFTEINVFTREIGFLTYRGAGKVPQRIELVIKLLEQPWRILEKPQRIKDLLFPDELLPKELDRSTLNENLSVFRTPEGVALVLTEKLLFAPGSSQLTPVARELLQPVAEVLLFMTADVNIAGHTDATPAGTQTDNYELSGRRALSVLDFFLDIGMTDRRFSVSGYGPERPLETNETEQGRARNRRVEILVKTTPFLGGYTN